MGAGNCLPAALLDLIMYYTSADSAHSRWTGHFPCTSSILQKRKQACRGCPLFISGSVGTHTQSMKQEGGSGEVLTLEGAFCYSGAHHSWAWTPLGTWPNWCDPRFQGRLPWRCLFFRQCDRVTVKESHGLSRVWVQIPDLLSSHWVTLGSCLPLYASVPAPIKRAQETPLPERGCSEAECHSACKALSILRRLCCV